MDFDDLEDLEEQAFGPPPEELRAKLHQDAKPQAVPHPEPSDRKLGAGGKMKLLYLHSNGTNGKVGEQQVQNFLQNALNATEEKWKEVVEFTVFDGPYKVGLDWHAEEDMRQSLKPYGPDFYIYYDTDKKLKMGEDADNSWWGWDKTVASFAKYVQEHGPYDGLICFNEGGTIALHAARRAQEGDPAFKGMFRFLILLTTPLGKELNTKKWKGNRPVAPLQIPTFVSWADMDLRRPYPAFEEAVLTIDEDYREVFRHFDGHKPPRLQPGSTEADLLKKFMQAMMFGLPWKPQCADKDAFGSCWLPIARAPAPPLPEGSRKRLVVVHEPGLGREAQAEIEKAQGDLMKLGPIVGLIASRCQLHAGVADTAAEHFRKAAGDGDEIQVDTLEYEEDHLKITWGEDRGKLPTRITLDPQDVVATREAVMAEAGAVALNLLDQCPLHPDDKLGIVGIGHGAFLALQLAGKLVKDRKVIPAGFWAVQPPTALPAECTEAPGLLCDCPLWYLRQEKCLQWQSSSWRWEVQTFGPFAEKTFKDRGDLAKTVLDDFRAR